MTEDIGQAPFKVSIREDDTSVRILIARNELVVQEPNPGLPDDFVVAIINRHVAYLNEDVKNAILSLGQTIGIAMAVELLGLIPAGVVIKPAAEPEAPKSH
jgi:hypothetical protein